MDFPLEFHENALLAAQAGRCAGGQGQFWLMHDRMKRHPQQLELKNLLEYAQDIKLDVPSLRQCVESGKYEADIQQGMREAMSKGIRGTPTFVIGKTTALGVEGILFVGAQGFALFDKALKDLIKW